MPFLIVLQEKRFWLTGMVVFLIALSYPIVLYYGNYSYEFWDVLRHDLSWSLYSLFLIPLGFGLLSSVFNVQVFLSIPKWTKIWFSAIYIIVSVGIIFAVLDDSKGIPSPERISLKSNGSTNYHKIAFETDRCLRHISSCETSVQLLDAVHACRDKYQSQYKNQLKINEEGLSEKDINRLYDGAKLKHAYFCQIITTSNNDTESIKSNSLVYVIVALNIINIIFVWSFVWLSHVYFAFARKEVSDDVLNILIGCFLILITWFPLRAYSEWYHWYGDLTHMFNYYPYWVLLVFSIELFALYAVWIVVRQAGIKINTAFAAVYSALSSLIAVFAGIKPDVVEVGFKFLTQLPSPLTLILLGGALLATTIYCRALLKP